MAFIAPLAGLAVGGGLLGSIVTTAVGVGINLAIAYFFPQKIKGPRAESLKAQTSRYGEQLARTYGSIRTAGAVVWLKGDHVDEHVKTERQGKALGPEVTTYSYTATFAVAFAWNGPFAAVPRIWADDKLIYDASSEALQNAIDNGGSAIGVAKGATVTIHLGTDDQASDSDIEADKGAGNVPAWPGICYVVIKNLPLDEFGIRVPNIEGELVRVGSSSYLEVALGAIGTGGGFFSWDTNGLYAAWSGLHSSVDSFFIWSLPAGTRRDIQVSTSGGGVHIDDRNNVILCNRTTIYVYDAATGSLTQTITRGITGSTTIFGSVMDDVTVGGTTYLLMFTTDGHYFTLLTNDGTGYAKQWETASTFFSSILGAHGASVGPDWGYFIRNNNTDIIRVKIQISGLSEVAIAPSGLTDDIAICNYDEDSDSVVIVCVNGDIFVYNAALSSLLRSKTGNGFTVPVAQGSNSKRMKVASDEIGIVADGNTVYIFKLSDLSLIRSIVPSVVGWSYSSSERAVFSFNSTMAMIFAAYHVLPSYLWFMPRSDRGPESLADIIEQECLYAGLLSDVSAISTQIYGYGDRAGTPPRGIIEDLTRVNFIDFAQIDGVQTFFPRETNAFRTITLDEIGMALNAEPDPVQISEEYPSALDMPEQVIITYPSYDAVYRIGAQAGNTKEDQKFNDEPSQADETGAPIKVRRKRAMEFSTAQVLTDQDAARVADILHNSLIDAATVYKTTTSQKHMDLHPGQVVNLPLDDTRATKAVLTKMSGDTVLEMEFRKRGDSYTSDAVAQPTPYVVDTLLGIADATPVLIDGHLLRAADNNDGFYAGVAVVSAGNFRSASIYRSEDGGSNYAPWAGFTNGMIRGIALDALPNRPHPAAFDRATNFNIAVPVGTAPDNVSEEVLLAGETSNAFAVWNASLGDWEYIRAASVVDNMDGTWTLSTLLRGLKGTEFAMVGHAAGAVVYHLDDQAMTRALEGDRTLSRIYVAVPTSTVFDSTGAVTFTNYGKGLRCWSPQLVSAVLDDGTGDWILTWNRRDRLGQAWPESGSETPPMSESVESYTINIYDGMGVLVNSYASTVETYTYTSADQTTDFGSPQTTLEFGIAQVSSIYGDGVELREAA
jgi:hypothetical protein